MAAAVEDVPGPDDWEAVVERLELTGVNHQLAVNCALKHHQGKRFELAIDPGRAQLHSKAREAQLREALRRLLGEDAELSIAIEPCEAATPARRQQQRRDARQHQAELSIEQDPAVQALRETFGAQINPGSVRPVD